MPVATAVVLSAIVGFTAGEAALADDARGRLPVDRLFGWRDRCEHQRVGSACLRRFPSAPIAFVDDLVATDRSGERRYPVASDIQLFENGKPQKKASSGSSSAATHQRALGRTWTCRAPSKTSCRRGRWRGIL